MAIRTLNPPFLYGLYPNIPLSGTMPTSEMRRFVGGNTGNLAFHYGIARITGITEVHPWKIPPATIQGEGRCAVIPCANQVGAHTNMGHLAKKLEAIRCEVVCVGLGAQATSKERYPEVPDGTLRWLEVCANQAPDPSTPNIAVRGQFTWEVLERNGFGKNAVVLGCPSHLIHPSPTLGRLIRARLGVARPRVAALSGHYRWTHLSKLENALCRMADASGGTVVTQSPVEMIALGRCDFAEIEDDVLEAIRRHMRPDLEGGEFQNWVRERVHAYAQVDAWMEDMRRHDLVVGPRIHGVMLALQAGTPAVCVTHDSRTLELCETMSIPRISTRELRDGITIKQVESALDVDWDAYDARRMVLAEETRDFLQRNGLPTPGLPEGFGTPSPAEDLPHASPRPNTPAILAPSPSGPISSE